MGTIYTNSDALLLASCIIVTLVFLPIFFRQLKAFKIEKIKLNELQKRQHKYIIDELEDSN